LNKTSAPALDVRLPAAPGTASAARRVVLAVAADQVADGAAVALAVSEAVTNVIVHAYRDRAPDSEPGQVHITVEVKSDELEVAVSDEGLGMQPRVDSPGAGLGLPIIATLTDRFEIQQRPTGTRLLLTFRLGARAGGAS
jgi:anti-sigma regulatory factor (Ser/Thr protein kinase)